MKRVLLVALVVLLGFGALSAGAEEYAWSKEAAAVAQALSKEVAGLLNADRVLGTPLELDGMLVVPVVSMGFAFGFGSGAGIMEEEEVVRDGAGGGAGAGGGMFPMGLLVIKDGVPTVMEASRNQFADALSEIVKSVMEHMAANHSAPEAVQATGGPEPEEK